MLDSSRRTKTISLRLSQREYHVLKSRYPTYGARNLSDFARLALERILGASDTRLDDTLAKLAELDDRLHALESCVALMTQTKP